MARRPKSPPLRDPEPPREAYVYRPDVAAPEPEKPDYVAELERIAAAAEYNEETAMAEAGIVLRAAMADGQYTPALGAVTLRAKIKRLLIDRREDTVRVTLEDLVGQVVKYRQDSASLIDITPEGSAD